MKKEDLKIKISVHGARNNDVMKSFDALQKAQELGKYIAKNGIILTVPAVRGFPYWVARGAKNADGHVIGFSPAASEKEHHQVYSLPLENMDVIVYSGFGYAGSDLLLSRSSDAVIFGYGGLETVHEFWVAFQEDKPIGVLKGEWDTDEILFGLLRGHEENFDHHRIIFDDDPDRLVKRVHAKALEMKAQSYHLKK